MKQSRGISKTKANGRFGLTTVVFTLLALTGARAQVLDQSQLDGSGFPALSIVGFDSSANDFYVPNGNSVAQTFTVGLTGKLTSMSVLLYKDPDFSENIDYFLLPVTNAGAPAPHNSSAISVGSLTTDQVADLSYPVSTGPEGWTTITFAAPISVTSGEHLALELAATGGNDGDGPSYDTWGVSNATAPYSGGQAFVRGSTSTVVPSNATWSVGSDSDLGFADFIIPTAAPEPRETAVAAAAMILLALWRIRRRRAGRI